jgi:hypothetical protein
VHLRLLSNASDAGGSLEAGLYDAQGRLVRMLRGAAESSRGTEETVLVWDGRRADGSLADPGVYYLQARRGPSSASRKILRLP